MRMKILLKCFFVMGEILGAFYLMLVYLLMNRNKQLIDNQNFFVF